MRRTRLSKNKFKNMSFFKKNLLIVMASLVLVCFTMVGYAALNQTLNITGDLVLRAKKDIRITNLQILETGNNGYEKYNSKFTSDTITVITNLEKTGDSITYQGTITNKGDMDMMVTAITPQLSGTNDSVNLTISGLEVEDRILEGESKTFTIKLERTTDVSSDDMEVGLVLDIDWEEATEKYLAYVIEGNSVYDIRNILPYPYDNSTKTVHGITFTVNSDGSVTADGTADSQGATFYFKANTTPMLISKGNYFWSCLTETVSGVNAWGRYDSTTFQDTGSGVAINLTEDKNMYFYVTIKANTTVENLVFKPQLEKGSVKTDWVSPVPTPNSPLEIASVGDKTKNLFDQSITKTATFSTFANTAARKFEEGVWYLGLTYNNYSNANELKGYDFNGYSTSITVSGQLFYGLAQAVKVIPNQTYSLSYESGTDSSVGVGFYDADGNWLSNKTLTSGTTVTTPENTYWMTVCLAGKTAGVEIVYSNVQLVLGNKVLPYEPYGKYKLEIEYSGKNLIDYKKAYSTYGTFSFIDNGFEYVGKWMINMPASLEIGKYYIFTADITGYLEGSTYPYWIIQYTDGTHSKASRIGLSLLCEKEVQRVRIYVSDSTEVTSIVKNIQLEEGKIATEYVPYVEPIIDTIYLDEPLRKVGSYVDYIDFETKTLHRNVYHKIVNGKESIGYAARTISFINIIPKGLTDGYNILCQSNYYSSYRWESGGLYSKGYTTNNTDTQGIALSGANIRLVDMIKFPNADSDETQITAFKAYLTEQYNKGTPLIIDYVRESPETSQLELKEILKQKGYTTVKVNTSVQPSNFTYEFKNK